MSRSDRSQPSHAAAQTRGLLRAFRKSPGRSVPKKTLALSDLHSDADDSIWEDFACQGYPVMTLLRGKVIVENGRLIGSSSDGRWLPRRIAAGVLGGPAL
jgi:hypothetical protein